MAKKLLTFLGTNQYVPVNYFLDDDKIDNCTFIQAAITQIICRNWSSDDQLIVFLTKDAEQKNWKTPNTNNYNGLEDTLKGLALPLKIKTVKNAPEGKNENEIWQYFDLILKEVKDDDEVYFDITHGFRTLPIITLVVMTYARALRNNVRIGGIYYGAFESLGAANEVKKLPLEERNAPIFDLTPLAAISEWSAGVNRFVETGDPSIICALTKREMKPILTKTKGQDEEAKNLKKLAVSLDAFYSNIVTCRGNLLTESIKDLKQKFNDVNASGSVLLPPLQPLLGKIKEKLIDITENYSADGLNAARWCFEHNLTQQGYTILQEFIVSYLMETYYPEQKINNVASRELFTSIGAYLNNSKDEKWTPFLEKNQALIDTIAIDPSMKEMLKTLNKLAQNRNDMNHAGFKDGPRKSDDLIKDLLNKIEEMEQLRLSLLERDNHTLARM